MLFPGLGFSAGGGFPLGHTAKSRRRAWRALPLFLFFCPPCRKDANCDFFSPRLASERLGVLFFFSFPQILSLSRRQCPQISAPGTGAEAALGLLFFFVSSSSSRPGGIKAPFFPGRGPARALPTCRSLFSFLRFSLGGPASAAFFFFWPKAGDETQLLLRSRRRGRVFPLFFFCRKFFRTGRASPFLFPSAVPADFFADRPTPFLLFWWF